ncbi:MAG: hypothetical protein LBH13_06530 [Cellulomonadaceae bacterium]|nr:hypothetical protein [Cellulomonadaceae bacterium]
MTACMFDECAGCLPRRVENPARVICEPCVSRLDFSLHLAWFQLAHSADEAREGAGPSGVDYDSDHRHGSDDGERIPVAPATMAAMDLDNLLTSWARCVLEDNPRPEALPDPFSVERERAGEHVVTWLLHPSVVGFLAQQAWVGDMLDELVASTRSIRLRWPFHTDAQAARDIPQVPCPTCDRPGALRIYPPSEYGQPRTVACTHCHRSFTELEWDRLVAIIRSDRGAGVKGTEAAPVARQYVTTQQAAVLAGVTPSAIRDRVARGTLAVARTQVANQAGVTRNLYLADDVTRRVA